ncbi:MAG: hypothetical protein KDK74_06125, partial [Cephaloticoccus sp.]|nr:hypothetical protein [Cephaloticoccus sp.]
MALKKPQPQDLTPSDWFESIIGQEAPMKHKLQSLTPFLDPPFTFSVNPAASVGTSPQGSLMNNTTLYPQ